MHLHDKIDGMRRRELIGVIRRQNEALRILRASAPPPNGVRRAQRRTRPA
jgi:hypothetical protein